MELLSCCIDLTLGEVLPKKVSERANEQAR